VQPQTVRTHDAGDLAERIDDAGARRARGGDNRDRRDPRAAVLLDSRHQRNGAPSAWLTIRP
jgi:hypothetical protein